MKTHCIVGAVLPAAFYLLMGTAMSRPLVQIDASLVSTDAQSQVATMRIDRIQPMIDGVPQKDTDTLVLSCPSADILFWRVSMVVGDTFNLTWRVVTPATRGWLFFGYQPQEIELTVPDNGIARSCECKNKVDRKIAHFTAVFRTVDGRSVTSLRFKGQSVFLPVRLIPFVKGNKFKPPKPVTLYLGWDSDSDSADEPHKDKDH